jgi:hypothetical protein
MEIEMTVRDSATVSMLKSEIASTKYEASSKNEIEMFKTTKRRTGWR